MYLRCVLGRRGRLLLGDHSFDVIDVFLNGGGHFILEFRYISQNVPDGRLIRFDCGGNVQRFDVGDPIKNGRMAVISGGRFDCSTGLSALARIWVSFVGNLEEKSLLSCSMLQLLLG